MFSPFFSFSLIGYVGARVDFFVTDINSLSIAVIVTYNRVYEIYYFSEVCYIFNYVVVFLTGYFS